MENGDSLFSMCIICSTSSNFPFFFEGRKQAIFRITFVTPVANV